MKMHEGEVERSNEGAISPILKCHECLLDLNECSLNFTACCPQLLVQVFINSECDFEILTLFQWH